MVERHNCHSNRSVEKQKKMMAILMNMVFKPGSADEPSQYLAIMGDYDDDNAYGWTQRSSPILSLPCSRWMVVVTCDSTVSLTHISNSYFILHALEGVELNYFSTLKIGHQRIIWINVLLWLVHDIQRLRLNRDVWYQLLNRCFEIFVWFFDSTRQCGSLNLLFE